MKINILAKLEKLDFFSKESLKQFEKKQEVLNFNIKYWKKKDKIIRLKNGMYVFMKRWENEQNKGDYLELLANKLYEPSYLSCEYVMAKYGLMTEAVYGLTSVTIKKTNSFINSLGSFSYYSISPSLFFAYEIKRFNTSAIFIAKKPKAVFDFLYFRFLKKALINEKVVAALRINWENIKKREFLEIKKFALLSRSKRLLSLINLIKKMYYA